MDGIISISTLVESAVVKLLYGQSGGGVKKQEGTRPVKVGRPVRGTLGLPDSAMPLISRD